jgi:hypothetical protein
MQFLENIKIHIAQLDEKTFLAYMAGFLLGTLLIVGGISYYYYSAVADLNDQITELNTKRSEMRKLFERETLLKNQEAEVLKLLKEDTSFSLPHEFKKICTALNLQPAGEPTPGDTVLLSGKYREYTLSTRFENIDMKQVCELLEAIEAVKRIYTKSIDITRTQSTPAKLNIMLVIGTLLTEIPGAS